MQGGHCPPPPFRFCFSVKKNKCCSVTEMACVVFAFSPSPFKISHYVAATNLISSVTVSHNEQVISSLIFEQVVFESVKGNTPNSDIAVDDYKLYDGACPPPGI